MQKDDKFWTYVKHKRKGIDGLFEYLKKEFNTDVSIIDTYDGEKGTIRLLINSYDYEREAYASITVDLDPNNYYEYELEFIISLVIESMAIVKTEEVDRIPKTLIIEKETKRNNFKDFKVPYRVLEIVKEKATAYDKFMVNIKTLMDYNNIKSSYDNVVRIIKGRHSRHNNINCNPRFTDRDVNNML